MQINISSINFILYLIIAFCFLAIILSVIADFSEFDKNNKTKDKKRSIVTTGTMFLFFTFFYILLRFGIGVVQINNIYLRLLPAFAGIIIIIIGTFVNIKGRIDLGKNWANQIKIYQNHEFITRGVYKIVRHPLYASLIWIFFGASLAYLNYGGFLANALIFFPFMHYRAKQEEKLLEKEFTEYKNYKLKTGMFFPKI
jgi:protein-S-isoprenylcysteine O-methyltransferase Ste14